MIQSYLYVREQLHSICFNFLVFQAELGDLVPDADLEEEAPAAPEPPKAPAQPSQPASSSGGQVGLLEERIDMYKKAEATAKSAGDSARARRLILNRFIKVFGFN